MLTKSEVPPPFKGGKIVILREHFAITNAKITYFWM